MKPPATKKVAAFKRDAPDLPVNLTLGLESNEETGGLSGDGESAEILDRCLRGFEAPSLELRSFRVEGCVLEKVQLAGGQFGSAIWKDVRLVGCDLANIRSHRITVVRVELVDCRLTGFRATALDWQDVLVQNGDVRYAQFRGGKFRNCQFEGCNLQEADFQNADLTGSVFRSCNLARADIRGAKLRDTDFRKSEVDGMLVGMNDLRGAIVDPSQAMVFAQVLGLQIR